MPQATFRFELEAKVSGYVSEIVADEVGTAAMLLGAGRATKELEYRFGCWFSVAKEDRGLCKSR